MKVRVEMGVKEFTLTARVAGFRQDEEVDIVLPTIALTARVESTKDSFYGKDQTPCTRIKLAITSPNIVRHKGKLGGATVTGRESGAHGTIYAGDSNTYTYPMVKQRYVTEMVEKLEELTKAAALTKDDARAKRWFGADLGKVQLERIHREAAAIYEGLQAVATMHFVCVSGVFIAAADMDQRQRYKPVGCQVQLGKGFTYQRYSWGEKVCSLAHELSHWFLGTVDETYQGEDAYGIKAFDMVNDVAEAERRKCLKNAENWGYYICSYRSDTDPHDWSNMTRLELEQREPFNPQVQTVNQAMIHAVA